jgi:hypothetical protein
MTIITIIAAATIAQALQACADGLLTHYPQSIANRRGWNPQFWNPAISWQNKWKPNSTTQERFWRSSRQLVFLTDAWHLINNLRNTATAIAITAAIATTYTPTLTKNVALFAIIRIAITLPYYLIWNTLFDKPNN